MPHMFLINDRGVLAYVGAIDDRAPTDQADIDGAKNFPFVRLLATQRGEHSLGVSRAQGTAPTLLSPTPRQGCAGKRARSSAMKSSLMRVPWRRRPSLLLL